MCSSDLFQEWPLVVEVPDRELSGFSHWLVNGQRREGKRLEFFPDRACEVQAVFLD